MCIIRVLLFAGLIGFLDASAPDIDSAIIGGQVARAGQFPFQVALMRNNRSMCAGALISSTFVLTAAHCVVVQGRRIPATEMSVRVGSSRFSTGGEVVGVNRITPHPQYAPYNWDVAVMRLVRQLRNTRQVRVINIRRSGLPANARVTIAGWGITAIGGQASEDLRFITAVPLTDQQCWTALGRERPTVLCLRSPVGQGPCRGDSGGAAIAGGQLVGVVSFARATCATDQPDGFASMSNLFPWIRENAR